MEQPALPPALPDDPFRPQGTPIPVMFHPYMWPTVWLKNCTLKPHPQVLLPSTFVDGDVNATLQHILTRSPTAVSPRSCLSSFSTQEGFMFIWETRDRPSLGSAYLDDVNYREPWKTLHWSSSIKMKKPKPLPNHGRSVRCKMHIRTKGGYDFSVDAPTIHCFHENKHINLFYMFHSDPSYFIILPNGSYDNNTLTIWGSHFDENFANYTCHFGLKNAYPSAKPVAASVPAHRISNSEIQVILPPELPAGEYIITLSRTHDRLADEAIPRDTLNSLTIEIARGFEALSEEEEELIEALFHPPAQQQGSDSYQHSAPTVNVNDSSSSSSSSSYQSEIRQWPNFSQTNFSNKKMADGALFAVDLDYRNILHISVLRRDLDTLSKAIKRASRSGVIQQLLTARDSAGYMPLHWAAQIGDPVALRHILCVTDGLSALEETVINERTVLFCAVLSNNVDCVRQLLLLKADPTRENEAGESPLSICDPSSVVFQYLEPFSSPTTRSDGTIDGGVAKSGSAVVRELLARALASTERLSRTLTFQEKFTEELSSLRLDEAQSSTKRGVEWSSYDLSRTFQLISSFVHSFLNNPVVSKLGIRSVTPFVESFVSFMEKAASLKQTIISSPVFAEDLVWTEMTELVLKQTGFRDLAFRLDFEVGRSKTELEEQFNNSTAVALFVISSFVSRFAARLGAAILFPGAIVAVGAGFAGAVSDVTAAITGRPSAAVQLRDSITQLSEAVRDARNIVEMFNSVNEELADEVEDLTLLQSGLTCPICLHLVSNDCRVVYYPDDDDGGAENPEIYCADCIAKFMASHPDPISPITRKPLKTDMLVRERSTVNRVKQFRANFEDPTGPLAQLKESCLKKAIMNQ